MTTRDDLIERRRLMLAERLADEEMERIRYGQATSLYDEALRRQRESLIPREDQFLTESNGYCLLFLRDLFSQHPTLPWRGSARHLGSTDVDATSIIIESGMAPLQRRESLSKPALIVNVGPGSLPEMVVGNLKHRSRDYTVEVQTGLAAGTIQVMCSSQVPAQALNLASFVALALRTHWKALCHQRWFNITEIAVGGYDGNNPLYNRGVGSKELNAIVPVTFTFYYQWTTRQEAIDGTQVTSEDLLQMYGDLEPQPYDVFDVSDLSEATPYATGALDDD